MTVDALRGKTARSNRREESESLPIGESDSNIFDCPACSRPLAVGTSRCPGCGTRLLARVKAATAVGFMFAGLVVGLVIGGGSMIAASALTAPADAAAPVTTPVVTASSAPAPAASVLAPAVDPGIPSEAISALRQSTLLNQRLATDAARLTATLAAAEPSSVDIARTLRALASNAAFGDRIAPEVGSWSAGAAVSVGLADFYAAIGATAREGLSASISNTSSYIESGRAMLAVMAGLVDLDRAARTLAGSADIELPPLVLTDGAAPEASAAP